MREPVLLMDRSEPVAMLTLNRPDKRNALNTELRAEVTRALNELASDDAISVVVVAGSGPAFCAGFDRSEFSGEGAAAFLDDPDRQANPQRFLEACQYFPKPLVAAIHGYCLGGGLDLAVQCDVRIAADDAVFGHPEIKFGAPTLYTQLSYIVGGGVARDLCLSGRRIDAIEAHRIGLANMIVPAAALADAAGGYATMVAEAPLETLKIVKRAIIEATPLKVP
jgi:enoyl-CoA hydratase